MVFGITYICVDEKRRYVSDFVGRSLKWPILQIVRFHDPWEHAIKELFCDFMKKTWHLKHFILAQIFFDY